MAILQLAKKRELSLRFLYKILTSTVRPANGLIIANVFSIVYRRTIELELKNIAVMTRYVCAVKNLLAIKINLLVNYLVYFKIWGRDQN